MDKAVDETLTSYCDVLTYTIAIENQGNVTATNVIESLEGKNKRLMNKLSLTDDMEVSQMILNQIKDNKKEMAKLRAELNEVLDEELEITLDKNDVSNVLLRCFF